MRVERRAHRCHWSCAMGTSGTSETRDRSDHLLQQIFVAVIRKIHLCACGLEWVSIQLNVPECASTCLLLKNNKLKARRCTGGTHCSRGLPYTWSGRQCEHSRHTILIDLFMSRALWSSKRSHPYKCGPLGYRRIFIYTCKICGDFID